MKLILWAAAFAAIAVAAAYGQTTSPAGASLQPATGPSTATVPATASAPASAPGSAPATATAPADVDPKAMAVLRGLQEAGQKYQTIKADIDYKVELVQVGDEERRTGWVAYQAPAAAEAGRFRVSFDTLRMGNGPRTKALVDYIFDGQWLSVVKHDIRQVQRYQVAAEGEKVEPLKLGKGPFPMPFGQNADEVVRYFIVITRDLKSGEPAGTVYLKLTPRREKRDEMNFTRLEMWVNPQTNLPVRLVSEDKSENVTTVTFDKIETGKEVDAKLFVFQRPTGYEMNITPLGGPAPPSKKP